MTDTTELVNDLRKPWTDVGHWQNLGQQAADEITRLQAELNAANEKLAGNVVFIENLKSKVASLQAELEAVGARGDGE